MAAPEGEPTEGDGNEQLHSPGWTNRSEALHAIALAAITQRDRRSHANNTMRHLDVIADFGAVELAAQQTQAALTGACNMREIFEPAEVLRGDMQTWQLVPP